MSAQRFGGTWTERKLVGVRKYLTAYMAALGRQPFQRIYINAFAGSGYRTRAEVEAEGLSLFDDPDSNTLAKGSARIALEVEPPFDQYIFIEQNAKHIEQLRKLEQDYPNRRDRMSFEHAEANTAILDLCRTMNWKRKRAVLFLDPYGMQVNWSTIEAVAATRAIDLLYLFPAGIGVSRLMPRHGEVPQEFRNALDRIFGDRGWYDEFFVVSAKPDLFKHVSISRERIANMGRIEAYFVRRLKAIFPGVSPRGMRLYNSKRQCMYLLLIACANPKGAPIAERIARAALKN